MPVQDDDQSYHDKLTQNDDVQFDITSQRGTQGASARRANPGQAARNGGQAAGAGGSAAGAGAGAGRSMGGPASYGGAGGGGYGGASGGYSGGGGGGSDEESGGGESGDLNDSEQAADAKPGYAGAPSQVMDDYKKDATGRPGENGGAGHDTRQRDLGGGVMAGGGAAAAGGGKSAAGSGEGKGKGGSTEGDKSEDKRKAGGDGKGPNLEKSEKDAAESGGIINAPAPKGKGVRGFLKGWSRRRRLVVGSIAGTVVFGGGGLGLVGTLAGPGQLAHAAQLLQQFHLDEKGRQGQHRTVLSIRNIRYIIKGEPQKTRMGYLGNKIADRIEDKFGANGIQSHYTGPRGQFRGYLILPQLLQGVDYDGIRDRSPAGVQTYLKEKFDIDATINSDGYTLTVSTQGMNYAQEARLVRSTMKLAGYDGKMAGLMGRTMMTRNDIDTHPIRKLTGASRESRYDQWKQRQIEKIRRGIRPFTFSAGTNQDPNNTASGGAQQVDDFMEEINQAAADFADGKPGALERLRTHVGTKFGGGASDIVGILCGALAFFENIDQLNHINVRKPMQQLGGNVVTVGNSAMTSHDDHNEESFGYHHDLMTDRIEKTGFFEARSIRAELGKPLSGGDIPASARLDPGGHIVSRTIGAVPGVRDTCLVVNSTAGQIVMTGVSLVLTGGINTLISTVVGAAGQELFYDELTKSFAAAAVPSLPEGEPYGSFANYGVRLLAKDYGTSMGATPISDEEDQKLGMLEREMQDQEFQGRSLADRLFDIKDARSFVARVIDGQTTDPGTNIARLTTDMLNVSKNVSLVAGAPFSRTLHAAPLRTDYNYGFLDSAFTIDAMNDPRFQNPFQNADRASDLLDASIAANPGETADNLVYRAKKCFGRTIERGFIQDRPAWTVMPPQSGDTPLDKDVLDPANKCFGEGVTAINTPKGVQFIRRSAVADEAWMSIQFYITDSMAVNALACDESVGDDPDLTKACVDIGQERTGGAAVVPTGTGGVPGQTKSFPNGGFSLNNGVDYSAEPCPSGTSETRIYEHTTEKFRIRVCKLGAFPAEMASIFAANGLALLNAAKSAGFSFSINSSFRTYDEQIGARRGNGCRQPLGPGHDGCRRQTAIPGNSEHERGLALDLGINGNLLGPNDDGFKWLKTNAAQHKFFNLPAEEWHWSASGT